MLKRDDIQQAALRLYDFCEYPAVRYKILFHLLDYPYDSEELAQLRPTFFSSDIVEELYQEQDNYMFSGISYSRLLIVCQPNNRL